MKISVLSLVLQLLSMAEGTDNTLLAFLNSLNLSQYFERFMNAGNEDLETFKSMRTEDELLQHVGITLPGHRRKLILNSLLSKKVTSQFIVLLKPKRSVSKF